jgi:F-type H+-transporting ATPase subunit b
VKLLRLIAILCALAAPAAVRAQEGEHQPAGEAHQPAGEAHETAAGEAHEGGEHAGGEHESPSIKGLSLVAQFFNFALLVVILVKFGGPAVNRALEARHQQIKSDLASAAEARAAAQGRFEHQEKRLAALESEIAGIIAHIKQEAEAEKARLIALAEERAKRIREESEFVIEQQVKQAEEDLRREVALAAVALAEQIVRNQMGASDQQRLVDSFVGDVAGGNGARKVVPHPPSGPSGHGAPRSEV